MKKQFLILAVLLGLVGSTGLFARGSGEGKITIGAIILDTRGEWMAEIAEGLKMEGEEQGIDVNIVSSEGDISKESGIIDTFISKGVDAIILMPQNDQGSVAAFERAVNEGIPVITFNSKVDSPLSQVFVGVDNYTLGKLAGVYAVDYINENMGGKATVGLLGISKYSIGIERVDGFSDQIKKLPGVKIVAKQDAEYVEEGLNVTESMLEAQPGIDFLWAWNQTSMLGAIAALKGQNSRNITMMGTDMSLDIAKTMLEEDFLKAVSTQQPYELGRISVKKAVELIKKGSTDEVTLVPVLIYKSNEREKVQKYIDERGYLQ